MLNVPMRNGEIIRTFRRGVTTGRIAPPSAVQWAAAAGAGLAVTLALIGQAGRISAAADFLNQFTPVWLTLGLAAALVMAIGPGRLRLAGLGAAAVLIATGGLAVLAEGVTGGGPTPARRPGEVRLVQFNLLKQNSAPEAAAEWIRDQDPDVVVLEEVALSGARVRDLLRQDFPYETDCLSGRKRCSTVIMSATPPLAGDGLARGDPENRAALSAAWIRLQTAAGPLTVVGVHYGRPWPYGDQTGQREALSRFVRSASTDGMAIAGDFNMTPWTFAMRRQDEAWPLRRVTRGLPSWSGERVGLPGGRTWVVPPLLPIDHVYLGRDWTATTVRRGPWLGSDHRPVMVIFNRR